MSDRINRLFTRLGVLSAHPGAVLILLLYTLLWIIFQPHTLDWHGVATLCTWFMTLLIQRADIATPRQFTPSWMNYSISMAKLGTN